MFRRISSVGLKTATRRRIDCRKRLLSSSTVTVASTALPTSWQSSSPLPSTTPAASNANDMDSTTTATATTTTHFGFEQVKVTEKEQKVRQVFDNVADSYDVMNDVMSAGIHRLWKDHLLEASCVESMSKAVRRQQQQSSPAADDESCSSSLRILDVAGGTGDIAFRFIEAADCVERAKSSGRDPISISKCCASANIGRDSAMAMPLSMKQKPCNLYPAMRKPCTILTTMPLICIRYRLVCAT
jgi:ubiE/COQ5 methyltransferase family